MNGGSNGGKKGEVVGLLGSWIEGWMDGGEEERFEYLKAEQIKVKAKDG